MSKMVKCTFCGQENDIEEHNCAYCGKLLPVRTCFSCGRKSSLESDFCPHCGTCFKHNFVSEEKHDRSSSLLFALIFIIFALSYLLWKASQPPKVEPSASLNQTQQHSEREDIPRPGIPYEFAKSFVKDRLVSPKTAEFPSISESRCILLSDKKTWKIISFVDSQNRFGAMIRTKWYVKIMDTGNAWKLLDIKFYDDI